MTSIPIGIQKSPVSQNFNKGQKQSADSMATDFGRIFSKQKESESASVDKANKKPALSKRSDGISSTDRGKESNGSEEKLVEKKSSGKDNQVREETDTNETDSPTRKDVTQTQEEKGTSGNLEMNADAEKLPEDAALNENVVEALLTTVTPLQNEMMQLLSLSDREFENLLREVDMSIEDLMNPEKVKELFLKSQGIEDLSVLLTDENLLEDYKAIQQRISDVITEQQLLNSETTKGEANLTEMDFSDEQNMEGYDLKASPIGNYRETEKQTSSFDERGQGQQGSSPAEKPAAYSRTQETAHGRTQETTIEIVPAQNNAFTTTLETVSVENENSGAVSYSDFSEMVMKQVTEKLAIQLSADASEVTMKLQPETLGTVQVQISAKEGVVTAHFSAGSEEVKAILEMQMELLKENFEQQNLKVDAIEVSVGTQLFNDSLLQEEQNPQEESREKKRRNVNIDDLFLDGEPEGEEKILAEMMAANGNTVDYLA